MSNNERIEKEDCRNMQQMLENQALEMQIKIMQAQAAKKEIEILGEDWGRVQSLRILNELANK